MARLLSYQPSESPLTFHKCNARPAFPRQVTAKMKYSHLELVKLLLDDLKYAGAPEKGYIKLRSLLDEQSKAQPEYFNSAHHYGEATTRALDTQHDVLKTLCQPQTWQLEAEETGDASPQKAGGEGSPQQPKFSSHEPLEKRWFTTVKMRSVAGVAARLGERGIEPAIGLLKLSLDPNHLCRDQRSGRLSISEDQPSARIEEPPAMISRQPSNSIDGPNVPPGALGNVASERDLRHDIRDKMDGVIRSLGVRATHDHEHRMWEAIREHREEIVVNDALAQALRVAYFVLRE